MDSEENSGTPSSHTGEDLAASLADRKSIARRTLRKARLAHPNPELASRQVVERLERLLAQFRPMTIAWYVDCGSEVQTRRALAAALNDPSAGRCHAAPACHGDELVFYQLTEWSDLIAGAYGILEPSDDVQAMSERAVEPSQFDLIIVPGVGFDESGNRLGQGRGYYDRYLPQLRSDVLKIGLAFECQVVDDLPHGATDVSLDLILTETRDIRVDSNG